MAAWIYPCDIPSIQALHPHATSNGATLNRLQSSKAQGDAYDVNAAKEAEETAQIIIGLERIKQLTITPDVEESAKNRAATLRTLHAAREFPIGGIADLVQMLSDERVRNDQRHKEVLAEIRASRAEMSEARGEMQGARDEMRAARDEMRLARDEMQAARDEMTAAKVEIQNSWVEMRTRLGRMEAELHDFAELLTTTSNNAITTYNRLVREENQPYLPKLKKVAGSGMDLWKTILPPREQITVIETPEERLVVGKAAPNFKTNIDTYHHADVGQLVEYYNEGLGIQRGDSLKDRKTKIRMWLTRDL